MRDLGDTTAYLRRGIREILCLALFVFTFLAVEYLFDVRVAEFVPSNEVVIYESIVIGASVIGFFVRPLLYYRRPQAIAATSDITGVLLVSALLLMIMAVQFQVVIAGGLVACCALGYCGSTAHANFARRFARTPCLARAAALSYAAGILVQVLNHMVMPAGIPQQFVLIACAIAQVELLHVARRAKLRDEAAPEFEAEIAELSVDASEYGAKWQEAPEAKAAFHAAVVRLTVATACLTGVFAALNAGLTTSHAAGAIDLGDWPRLLLILSVLAAGVLYDLHGRSYMNIIMTCAAMLSTLSFFLLITDANGGNVLAATMIFYLGSGFFVVFFTAKFAAVSMYARWAYLWPCMGRVINNICTLLVTAPAVAIISSQNVLTAVAVVLVLFVGIAISLLGQFGQGADGSASRGGGWRLPSMTLARSMRPNGPIRCRRRLRSCRLTSVLRALSPPLALPSASAMSWRPWLHRTTACRMWRRRSSFRAPHSTATLHRSTKRSVPIRAWRSLASSGPGHPKTS